MIKNYLLALIRSLGFFQGEIERQKYYFFQKLLHTFDHIQPLMLMLLQIQKFCLLQMNDKNRKVLLQF